MRTFQRILKRLKLKCKNVKTCSTDIASAVLTELEGSGSLLGYRSVHQRLKSRGIVTDRESVRICMKVLEPAGVSLRKQHKLARRSYCNKGPNYLWHIDGNDKLKPFGLCIHGAIDGFSRKVLWLNVSPSNKDPSVISKYFLDFVSKINGSARVVRADRGVENCIIAGMQRYFHREGNQNNCFLFGRSTANQRIEAWWSYLRKNCLQWWMNYFKDLRDRGIFDDSNIFHTECLRFCFLGIFQDELTKFMTFWNHHRIRKVKNSESPCGIPDYLYYNSGFNNDLSADYKINVDMTDITLAKSFTKSPNTFGCSEEFSELAMIIIQRQNLSMPKTVPAAEILYTTIVNKISSI